MYFVCVRHVTHITTQWIGHLLYFTWNVFKVNTNMFNILKSAALIKIIPSAAAIKILVQALTDIGNALFLVSQLWTCVVTLSHKLPIESICVTFHWHCPLLSPPENYLWGMPCSPCWCTCMQTGSGWRLGIN